MSRQVRHRVTAMLLGAFLVGTPSVANAGQISPPAAQKSDPALVTPMTSVGPTPTPEPVDAVSIVPSHSAVPDSGSRPSTRIKTKHKIKVFRGTGGSVPMSAGKPPGEKKASARRVPTLDLPSRTHSAPAAPARHPSRAAAEQAANRPVSENGLIGLLAAVSIVLVLGVSAGVIRAIVSERASRTNIA